MTPELRLVIIGGVIGIVGALLGAGMGAIIDFWLGEKRDQRLKRLQNRTTALEWAATGRTKNLRHIDLQGQDLRGADFCNGPDQDRGADLSYSDLRQVDLSNAQLVNTDLRGADMRGAILANTNLSGAILVHTNLSMTNLGEAVIDEANLYGANLLKANVTIDQLRRSQTFDRATLQDGKLYIEDDEDDGEE